jgi:outer membrane protein OmpA-like peptidoglycan-associated protein
MIKKSTLALLLTSTVCLTASSQSFIGYGYDNYAGVNGMILNPGTLADNKYKVNVNLFAVSALGANNAYEMDRSRLFGFHFSHLQEGSGFYKSNNTAYKYVYTNLDILGPSATISLTPKDGLGITTRMRVIGNEYNLGNPLFQLMGDKNASFYNTNIVNRSLQAKMNSFAEVGLSYGRVLFKDDHAEIKLGVTGKYIAGLGYGSLSSGPTVLNLDPTNMIVNAQADVTAQYSSNLDNLNGGASISNMINKRSSRGFGFDLGFVYELKGKDPNTTKMRLGASITDIGSMSYVNSSSSHQYTLTATGHNVSEFQELSGESLQSYFTRIQSSGLAVVKSAAPSSKVSLPTALHLNIDYNIYKRIYINGDILLNMLATTNPISPNYVTTFTATPRLEKKWVSIYSPVSYSANGQLNWGAGVRIGPLFVGSGSVLSSMLKKRVQAADAHIGLTIPIFQHRNARKEPKLTDSTFQEKPNSLTNDRDGDGVVDAKDECPDSAGPVKLIGCPDDDGDGVPNYKDKCPKVKGSINFQGCPAPDSDGDSVNDDEDKCPLVKGVASNYGCPPIKPEYINTVSRAADRIFFVRAKAVIEVVSFGELDRVVSILQEDSTLRLRIEGHTDSEGTDQRNQKLSDRRAKAVYNYLLFKGIAADRMEFAGFGSKKPLAPNDTPEGMSVNRRTEMILMNYPKDKK